MSGGDRGGSRQNDANDRGESGANDDPNERDSRGRRSESTDADGSTRDRTAADRGRDDRGETRTHRLHPRIRILWIARATGPALLFGIALALVDRFAYGLPDPVPAGGALSAFLLGAGIAMARYRLWRYEIRGDALYLERGVFTRVRTVVPFVRIQHVDSSRRPAERLTGLATVVVYTAGSRGADVTIPGLTPEGAEDLRERLKRLAIRAEGEDAV